jgi:hypothetical protein
MKIGRTPRWNLLGATLAVFLLATTSAAHSQDILGGGSRTNPAAEIPGHWTPERANAWYAQQPWLVGADYIPSDAINELVMFQAATWNPALNERELGFAQGLGMNTVRVFLQDQLWQQDPAGFKQRLDAFLSIAARHNIRPMLVLFDSCWDPHPRLGPQHPPIPGVHNSGWVQSPGADELSDPTAEPRLKAYVVGIVGAFRDDKRILAWDVWNEPDNLAREYRMTEIKNKVDLVDHLLPLAFQWAREAHPTQPLTTPVWQGDWHDPAKMSETVKLQLAESDVITFHDYGWPEQFEARVRELQPLGRPIICTEYMARGAGSTIEGDLAQAKQMHVAMYNWGLIEGATQTTLPWDSWQRPYVLLQPQVWHHDLLYPDGAPYREHEAELLRTLTGRGSQ